MSKRRNLKDPTIRLILAGKTAREIADELGCDQPYVRATARRNGLDWNKTYGRLTEEQRRERQLLQLRRMAHDLGFSLVEL